MAYLIEIHIGPVQSFIASSRRTRDLWFGSTLLSELAKTAAHEIVRNRKNELIFPSPATGSEEDLAINSDFIGANKILAKIDDAPQQLGEAVHRAITQFLNKVKQRTYEIIDPNFTFSAVNGLGGPQYIDWRTADLQISDLVEYYWAALPLDDAKYAETRQLLAALIAARKNTRDFNRVTWGNKAAKSSIDGLLESVTEPNQDHDIAERVKNPRFRYKHFRAGPAERLSGVDLLKRLGVFTDLKIPERNEAASTNKRERFLSTSHVAALPYLQCLSILSQEDKKEAREQVSKKWDEYIQSIESAPDSSLRERIPSNRTKDLPRTILEERDGALLFPERLREELGAAGALTASKHLNDFFEVVDKYIPGGKQPGAYYAIIQADGDRMGKVIDYQAEGEQGWKQHQKISQALSKFSKKARVIVEEKHQGSLIYAGGDDVQAFVPLHRAFDCAQQLAKLFSETLGSFKDQEEKPPTLSVGIAIVHHLSLLQDALQKAREAEARAKAVNGKNALAIKVCKRSGEEYAIVDRWNNLQDYFKLLIDYFRKGYIPKGTAYELRAMLQRLTVSPHVPESATLQSIIHTNAGRILRRKLHLPSSGQDELDKQAKEKILQTLKARYEPQTPQANGGQPDGMADHEDGKGPVSMAEFINEFIVANELAEAINLAEGKMEGTEP